MRLNNKLKKEVHHYNHSISETEHELSKELGKGIDVDIHLEEIKPEKNVINLSASIHGLDTTIFIKQKGRSFKNSLTNLKKTIINKVRSYSDRRIHLKRRNKRMGRILSLE